MKHSMICTSMLFLLLTHAPRAQAQQYAATANDCVREFYDPQMYGWFSYQNTCTGAINVYFVSRSGTNRGALDIGPGNHAGTGASEREIKAMGGLVTYACPAHYSAVDAADRQIVRVVGGYRCKRSY